MVELSLWDTAGQEQFASLAPMYSRGVTVCVLVASISDSTTCNHLLKWKTILVDGGVQAPLIVAFNKVDLISPGSDVRFIYQMTYAQHFKEIYFVSAKTGDGIDNLFQGIALAASTQPRRDAPPPERVNLAESEPNSGCKC
jgi:small GTP-binding protein